MENAIIKLLDYDLEESMNKTPTPQEKSKGTMDKLKSAVGMESDTPAVSSDDNILTIQLSPESLSFSSSGETKQQNRDMQSKDKEQKQDAMSMEEVPEKNQTLSFDFYVDGSKKISSSSSVNTISPVKIPPVSNLSEGYSGVDITQIVEGFKDLARIPHLSHVAFCWGKMYYEGFVKSINTEYMMFTNEGKPVRAKLSLSMELLSLT